MDIEERKRQLAEKIKLANGEWGTSSVNAAVNLSAIAPSISNFRSAIENAAKAMSRLGNAMSLSNNYATVSVKTNTTGFVWLTKFDIFNPLLPGINASDRYLSKPIFFAPLVKGINVFLFPMPSIANQNKGAWTLAFSRDYTAKNDLGLVVWVGEEGHGRRSGMHGGFDANVGENSSWEIAVIDSNQSMFILEAQIGEQEKIGDRQMNALQRVANTTITPSASRTIRSFSYDPAYRAAMQYAYFPSSPVKVVIDERALINHSFDNGGAKKTRYPREKYAIDARSIPGFDFSTIGSAPAWIIDEASRNDDMHKEQMSMIEAAFAVPKELIETTIISETLGEDRSKLGEVIPIIDMDKETKDGFSQLTSIDNSIPALPTNIEWANEVGGITFINKNQNHGFGNRMLFLDILGIKLQQLKDRRWPAFLRAQAARLKALAMAYEVMATVLDNSNATRKPEPEPESPEDDIPF